MATVIWWIRRDLRLEDNQALQYALSNADSLIPLYILDPTLLSKEAPKRKAFLFNSLHSLAEKLEELNCPLIVRRGDPQVELPKIFKESNAQLVSVEADYSPYAQRRDCRLARKLPFHFSDGLAIHPPGSVVKPNLGDYTVFTPFSRTWKSLRRSDQTYSSPTSLPSHPELGSHPIPSASANTLFPATENEAQNRLRDFFANRLADYAQNRDRMDIEGTSLLSPYLRFGILSVRYIYTQLRIFRVRNPSPLLSEGIVTWSNELIWRDFFIHILFAFPYVLNSPFRKKYASIPWRNNISELNAWKSGLTGYPVVDAAMRQLRETGWMHNRARMITAPFLTKDLLVNWQEGEAWFMRNLIDGDPAANNGGWQWTAGTGTDAAPYFRVFNPILQSRKFDPHGKYIHTWVPELGNVPEKYVHEPWKMPLDIQSQTGIVIGRDYPKPIVDHKIARERAHAAYKASA